LGGPPTVRIQRGTTAEAASRIIETAGGNGFLLEAESFQRMLTQSPEQWNGVSEAESIDIIMTLEAIAESARSGRAVDLP
jgi:predicted dehydrogenase